MSAVASVVPETSATGPRLTWLRDRGMGASVLVAALVRIRRRARRGYLVHRRDAAGRPLHRRQRHARVRRRDAVGAAHRRRALRRGDRDGQHVLDDHRRAYSSHCTGTSDRRQCAFAACRSRASGVRRRHARRCHRPRSRPAHRVGRSRHRRSDAGTAALVLVAAARDRDSRTRRRADDVGGSLGRISSRALRDAVAGDRGLGGTLTRMPRGARPGTSVHCCC